MFIRQLKILHPCVLFSPPPISLEAFLFLNDPIAFVSLSNLKMHGNEKLPELDEKKSNLLSF